MLLNGLLLGVEDTVDVKPENKTTSERKKKTKQNNKNNRFVTRYRCSFPVTSTSRTGALLGVTICRSKTVKL